jgi:GT2 family glycosyltransferase/preprotein translocase subunit Sec61beta
MIAKNKISFVIPVLDYSKASPYNINTLLADLKDIDGEVIVIFNNEQLAYDLKDHPRIDHYAILKSNVGVSRAWNIGINICRTPYTFILNADVTIKHITVRIMEHYLDTLKDAAIVGPQGAFVDYENNKDYYFFQKGSFDKPIVIDAVSGFLFAINNKLFSDCGLAFDNRYTPCYFEEWDIGLQIKSAGLKAYIVPTDGYDHQWSGSIKTYREIKFYDQSISPGEIQKANAEKFRKKWLSMIRRNSSLTSGWKTFALNAIEIFISRGQISTARNLLNKLLEEDKGDKEILAGAGLVSYYEGSRSEAINFFKSALAIDPTYEVAANNIKIISESFGD